MSDPYSATPGRQGVDLLLLSASNYPALPIYPYAFVQVSAVAAHHGLTTARFDLLRTPKSEWRPALAATLERTDPRLIGIHLRQLDSIFIWNYADADLPGAPPVRRNSYWPMHETEELIGILRELTDTPVMLGGFGFTTRPQALLERLRPEFGVVGEPDEILGRFDDVLAGRGLDGIANLAHRHDDSRYTVNERVFLPPAEHPEYTEEILRDLLEFYGPERVLGPEPEVHVPVEVQRGCPYRCYFCTEPMVKGRRHRVRNPDAVMADIRFLADRGVTRIWLVCSEINVGRNTLLFELAERMRELNRDRPRPVHWTCYLLPNPPLGRAEIRLLLESEFEPSWNQFGSYDDANLKRTRVPYRARHAIQAQVSWLEEEQEFRRERGLPLPPRRLDMFLGNSYATPDTVATTLRAVSDLRLAERFEDSLITRATRVFDLGEGLTGEPAAAAYSVGPHGRLDTVDLLYPTFSYPPALVAALGDARAVDEFFAHVEATYLSRAHRSRLDWQAFLARHTSAGELADWCARPPGHGAPDDARVRAELAADGGAALVERLLAPAPGAEPEGPLARALLELVVGTELPSVRAALAAIGLPGYWEDRTGRTAYEVCAELAARFDSVEEVLTAARAAAGPGDPAVPLLAVRYCLYDNNVVLRPDYSRVLFAS
ncbi:B12-binding domain-containing radical SAM protein [Kitasatospora sp. NPDC058162]|uniref:B12-binding domain-containing radical SAM protein n=1 Tax=Kitasatospora sp. NPDC058162 TaxID=3346362 RepID=UPI0036DAF707